MAIDVLKKVTQGAVKGAMAAGAAAMGAAQTPRQAALAAAQQPTYQLPANWFNGMARMGSDGGWVIDNSNSDTWKQIAQMYRSGNTQGAIDMANSLQGKGQFGGYWDEDGKYWGYAQGYAGGANASMQPVIGNQLLTPRGLEYEHTNLWLTPDGKVLNLGQNGALTDNGETWGTANDNSGTLTGRWFQENGTDPKDVSATTWTAWGAQQGWTPAETLDNMSKAGAFTNPALNTPQGNQQRLAELQANPNADPAAIAATQQTLNQQQAAASSGGNTIYQEAVNQADAGGTPTGRSTYSSGGAGAYVPTQTQPLSFDEWYARYGGGGNAPSLAAPEAYDPDSDPYWLAYLEAYGGSAAPEWTGGEYDHTQNTAYQQYLKDWADAHAPEYAGDPYKARRDAAIEAYTEKWGGSPYQAMRDDSLRNAANMKWNYDPDTDPVWQAYQKQYRREGQRATEDTLGRAAGMTGGMPSSYAVTAASQAGNYYASQLSDKLPQLYRDAYDRYLKEYERQLGLSEAYGQADTTEYGRWLDSQNQNLNLANAYYLYGQQDYDRHLDQVNQFNKDREFAYGTAQDSINNERSDWKTRYQQYLDEVDQFNKSRDFAYGAARDNQKLGMDMSKDEYNRYIDSVNQANYEKEMAYKQYRDTIEDARVDREWAQKLLEYADSQGWKWREWNQYLTEYGDQLSQKEREWAYKVMRDQVSDEQDAKEMELSMAQLGAKYGDYSGLSGLGIDTSSANPKEVAYASDGSMYKFNTHDALYFVKNAPNGTPGNPTAMTGSDGSAWRKDEYGNVTITTKNGKVFTYSNNTPTVTGSGKYSGGGKGSGSGGETYSTSTVNAAYKAYLNGDRSDLTLRILQSAGLVEPGGIPDEGDPESEYAVMDRVLADMQAQGRPWNQLLVELDAELRDERITREEYEALRQKYVSRGLEDGVANLDGVVHRNGSPMSAGFSGVWRTVRDLADRQKKEEALAAMRRAYEAGTIHEYEIDVMIDQLGW